MIRNWKVAAAIASLLLIAGLGAGLAFGLSGSSSIAAPPLTSAEQMRLEQGVTSPTVTAEAGVLALEVRSQFEQAGRPLLSPGSHLSIDAATFQAVSAQVATVDATETGGNSGRWQLTLVWEAGYWQLLGSRKLP